jgi:CheY-like chemotaxis protein
MMSTSPPRILVVDDEEAILETMTFTFEDDYEVYTSNDARAALKILDEKSPFAVVLTDQRMPNMDGVEFLTEVCQRHPATVRMILTGFSDMEAIIQAINDGHVYAYITKPWEPDQLKQVMKQAIDHYELTIENERLVTDLQRANVFLEAVMDRLDTGALAVDESGVIQAVNRPARDYLSLSGDVRRRPLKEVLEGHGREELAAAAYRIAGDEAVRSETVELGSGDQRLRLRVTSETLRDESNDAFGRVIFLREISHEPLLRRFGEIVGGLIQAEGAIREPLESAREDLPALTAKVQGSRIDSPGMNELSERVSRTLTAIENWLDVDEALAREDFPDSQVLQDRMRIAMARWPLSDEVPERVRELARRVEEYYESGENSKQRVL